MFQPRGAGTPPPDDVTLVFRRANHRGPLPEVPPAPPPPPMPNGTPAGARAAGGLVLLAGPVLALVLAYVLPTLRTIEFSRQGSFDGGDSESVGWDHFASVLDAGRFADGLAALAGPVLVLVLAGAVLAPLLALLLDRAGSAVRTAARIAWSLAAISFAPAAVTVAWLVDRAVDGTSGEASLYDWPGLIAGVAVGAGVLVGLAALRSGRAATLTAAAGLTALALAAAGLQTFAFGEIGGFTTPVGLIYEGLRSGADVGSATAVSVLLLAILAVLGIGATVLFVAARTRIDVAPVPDRAAATRPLAAVAGIAALALALAAVGFFLWPWLTRLAEGGGDSPSLWLVIRRVWGPPLITTGVGLAAAALGGFAIGAVRPFGDASRWLLLAFAPWLFTGSGPLGAANLEAVAGEGEWVVIGSFAPRAWIAVPVLFLFTALFWGLEDRRRADLASGVAPRAAWAAFAKAAWPFAALMAMVLLLVHAQDHLWQELTFQDLLTTSVMTYALGNLDVEQTGVGYGFPLPVLVLYAFAAVAFALWYLPRLAIRTGR